MPKSVYNASAICYNMFGVGEFRLSPTYPSLERVFGDFPALCPSRNGVIMDTKNWCRLFLFCWCATLAAQPLTVTPSFWDFGTITDDQMQHSVFTVHNRSREEVKLTPLPTTCGCTASYPKPDVVPAGGTSELYIVFHPRGIRGMYRWEVALQTSLPEQLKIVIPMQAYVLRNDILSENMVNFRIFKRGEKKEYALWLTCHKYPEFRLKKVATDIPGFDTRVIDSRDITVLSWDLLWPRIQAKRTCAQIGGFYPGPQRGYRIDIIAREDIGYGRNHGEVVLTTDIPGQEEVKLRLFAYVLGEITAAPDYLSFGLVHPGMTAQRKIILSHNDYKPFRVEPEVGSSLDFITARVEEVIPEKYYYVWVSLQCPQNAGNGEFRGTLSINTDCPTHRVVGVHVQGFVQNPAAADVPDKPLRERE